MGFFQKACWGWAHLREIIVTSGEGKCIGRKDGAKFKAPLPHPLLFKTLLFQLRVNKSLTCWNGPCADSAQYPIGIPALENISGLL